MQSGGNSATIKRTPLRGLQKLSTGMNVTDRLNVDSLSATPNSARGERPGSARSTREVNSATMHPGSAAR